MINNNRQAGRRRGRGGQQQRPQGSGRQDSGNRIDNRSRGNAAQLLEKYKALARDAQMSGDRVNTEYYLQFADHYFRVLAETRSRFEENNRPIQGGANTFQDDEQEYDDEGEPVVRSEQPRQNEAQRADQYRDGNRDDQGRQDGNRQDQGRQDQGRQDQGRQDQGRQDQGRQDQGRATQGRQYQGDRQYREGQDRQQGQQDRGIGDRQPRDGERSQYDGDRQRRQNGNGGSGANYVGDQATDRYVRNDRGRERQEADDRAPQEVAAPPVADTPVAAAPQAEEAPRRRGRPRREPVADATAGLEADRLPPSLNVSAVTPVETAPANDIAAEGAEEKPRRRRGRPPASESSGA